MASATNAQRERRFTLSPEEREFFCRLSRFVFANPFSAPRDALLAELLPGMTAQEARRNQRALSAVVSRRVERFDAGGAARLTQFSAEDRPLLRTAFLYLSYQRYVGAFDTLIERQMDEPAPLPVEFAGELEAELVSRGLGAADVERQIALFFQLRRAFYFIERSLPGDSPSMRRLRLALWNNTFTHDMGAFEQHLCNRMEEFSTLLLGETGTGKGSAAAAIGRSGFIPYESRKRRFVASFADSFVSLNLSQFPETLVESELFGHRKGAFTGAIADHSGVFERCSKHGALFLDEIGEIAAPLQVELLQVLQERSFSPLGSHERLRFHGRVIAATNLPLETLRGSGGFRDDLFYRLCSDVIVMPPLRQRLQEATDELPQLVRVLIQRTTGEGGEPLVERVLDALARDLPRDYPWSGNVRELEQAVRRVLLTGAYQGERRAPPAVPDDVFVAAVSAGRLDMERLAAGYCALLYRRHGTYVEVARRTGLDRRTVRRYIDADGVIQ